MTVQKQIAKIEKKDHRGTSENWVACIEKNRTISGVLDINN